MTITPPARRQHEETPLRTRLPPAINFHILRACDDDDPGLRPIRSHQEEHDDERGEQHTGEDSRQHGGRTMHQLL